MTTIVIGKRSSHKRKKLILFFKDKRQKEEVKEKLNSNQKCFLQYN